MNVKRRCEALVSIVVAAVLGLLCAGLSLSAQDGAEKPTGLKKQPREETKQKAGDAGAAEAKPAEAKPAEAKPAEAKPAEAKPEAPVLPWIQGLTEGLRRAMLERRPVFVRATADACPWCRKLEAEIKRPEVQKELGRWTLVEVNVDRLPDEAGQLAVGTTPALRLLTPGGQAVASRDGYLGPKELLAWLEKHFEAASAAADDVLMASGKPGPADVVRLVNQLPQRNPVLREAAIRRLLPYPEAARQAVVKALQKGNLSTRLAATELLTAWKAPVEKLDPWQPESVTAERIAALARWAEGPSPPPAVSPEKLSEEQLAEARRVLDRMARVNAVEVEAIREQLARFGAALLPEVYVRLKQAATDDQRERLLALRYRLAAGDALVLKWPGGLVRLAAVDSRQRQQAAEELVRVATADDQRLLLEIFSDPDPLVREISLRGLQQIGGKEATGALVRLLEDPEPNVRAAVLKQLTEKPVRTLVPQVAAYVGKETDADLVVHAVRFFREAKGQDAVKALMGLLAHPQWQVRAEAAEAIGQALSDRGSIPQDLQADAYVALIKLLDDADAFVVSRALAGLQGVDTDVAVEPLVKAAGKHPDLILAIVEMLARNPRLSRKALPHLRAFAKHQDPSARAAALRGLVTAMPDEVQEELTAGLKDADSRVRAAAAAALFSFLDRQRTNRQANVGQPFSGIEVSAKVTVGPRALEFEEPSEPPEPVTSRIVKFLLGRKDEPKPAEPTKVETRKATEPEKKAESAKAGLTKEPPKAADAKPAEPGKDTGDAADQWLLRFYEGRGRPKWMSQLVEPLEKMLRAKAPEERVEAALALVPLGRADRALPVLLETVRAEPKLLHRANSALPWLVWEKRLDLFHKLSEMAGKNGSASGLIMTMTEGGDRRAADLYWQLLADPKLTLETAYLLQGGLRQAYYGQRYVSTGTVAASRRRELAAAVKPRAAQGSEFQRLVALALLLDAAPDEAAEVAGRMAADTGSSDALRLDAFQIVLLAEPKQSGLPKAVEAMTGNQPEWRKIALSYLADGKGSLRVLRRQFYLQAEIVEESVPMGSDQPRPVVAPKGLRIEHVRPLLTHPDPQIAAYAGYLAAILGEREGLKPLLKYWQQEGDKPERVERLVYRAIAALDDTSQIAVLRDLAAKLDQFEMRDLYWTVRGMSGQEMVKFRKEIRDKVGMENLR